MFWGRLLGLKLVPRGNQKSGPEEVVFAKCCFAASFRSKASCVKDSPKCPFPRATARTCQNSRSLRSRNGYGKGCRRLVLYTSTHRPWTIQVRIHGLVLQFFLGGGQISSWPKDCLLLDFGVHVDHRGMIIVVWYVSLVVGPGEMGETYWKIRWDEVSWWIVLNLWGIGPDPFFQQGCKASEGGWSHSASHLWSSATLKQL